MAHITIACAEIVLVAQKWPQTDLVAKKWPQIPQHRKFISHFLGITHKHATHL